MQTLDLILSKSRGLVRHEKLDIQTATQRAIDEVAEGSNQVLDELQLQELAMRKLTAYGALQPFMDDGEIEEIWINRPNELHYFGAKGYRKAALDLPASELRSICYRLLSHSKRRVDRLTPFVDAAISDGSRLHIVIPEITQEHWAINIRKFPKANVTLADLRNLGTIDDLQHRRLSRAMANGNFFAHQGPDGLTPGDRAELAGYEGGKVGENIAAALDSTAKVVEGWLAIPGHCANIMNPEFSELGAAYANDPQSDAGIYWTALFGGQ
jgi:hypothetical protein